MLPTQKIFIFLFLSLATCYFLLATVTFASHCPTSDYDCQIKELQTEIDALSGAHENNKKELSGLNTQLTSLKKRISSISSELGNVQKDITNREFDLAFTQEIFNQKSLFYNSKTQYLPYNS